MQLLSELLNRDAIQITNQSLGNAYIDGWNCKEYRSTLSMGENSITIPFRMGLALTEAPSVMDIMSSLVMEASGVQNGVSFEDWANEYGYDSDSRKAEKIYNQCLKQSKKLKTFLGDKFDEYLSVEIDD